MIKLKAMPTNKDKITSNKNFGNKKSTLSQSDNSNSYVADEEYVYENPDGKN